MCVELLAFRNVGLAGAGVYLDRLMSTSKPFAS